VVDLDLEKFFDPVNHDLLIKMVRETVKDEAIITLIKKFIKSGVMADGQVSRNELGLTSMCVYLGIGCSGGNRAGTLWRLESAQVKESRWYV
jgi:hypothetical protein